MQNLESIANTNSPSISGSQAFAAVFILLVAGIAFLSALSPISFAMTVVMVFGAPHIWLEFRYFLSHLPSRFAPFRAFFTTAFGGAFLLALAESTIFVLIHKGILSGVQAKLCLIIWNELLIIWILALCCLRYHRYASGFIIAFAAANALLLTSANLLSPVAFIALLTYIHPLVGLLILEREIRRTRKSWLRPLHFSLLAIPLAVLWLIWLLSSAPFDSRYGQTLSRLTGNEAYLLFANTSQALILSIYAFLQMVHYAVWVIAMPIVTKSWKRWRLDVIPVLRNRARLRAFAGPAIAAGGALVVGFWLAFKLDCRQAMEIYALLSTLHCLAEIPFTFWMLEG